LILKLFKNVISIEEVVCYKKHGNIIINDGELSIRKKAIMTNLKAVPWSSPGKTDEHHESS
jgi:hypothetical protein